MGTGVARRFFNHDVDLTNPVQRKKWMIELSQMLDDLVGAHNSIDTFESDELTISANGTGAIPHGKSVAPFSIAVSLVCKTAESGYAIGDVVNIMTAYLPTDVSGRGVAIKFDSTNISYKFNSNTNPMTFTIINFSTGGVDNVTNANWKMVIKALFFK